MPKTHWLIRGYDSMRLIFEREVKAGQLSEEEVKALLRTLAAKAGLSFDEIVGAYAKRRTGIANDLLFVQKRRSLSKIVMRNESILYC